MPVVEGSELSLSCLVQGSSSISISWYKDGYPIDVNTGNRGMWTTVVPKNFKDQYKGIIGFDKVHLLDSGDFTCEVSDWGTLQNKSVQVTVLTVPKPSVLPLTSTVTEGSPFVVTCLSDVDRFGSFGYNWLKNGNILNPSSEPEMVEDLFPAGSRLLVRHATVSGVYTCIVTSSAGAARRDSVVTVVANDGTVPICPEEEYLGITWGKAAANSENIQLCPPNFTGEVKRYCVMKTTNVATWSSPDYSGCYSKEFSKLKEKFLSLRMGYKVTDLSSLLGDLRQCLWNMKETSLMAGGEPVVDFLEDLHDYEKTHGEQNIEKMRNDSQVFMDIVSYLLDTPQLIQRPYLVIKLHQQILNHGLFHGSSLPGPSFHIFERSSLILEAGQLPRDVQRVWKFPTSRQSRSVENFEENLPGWLTDSVELDFDSWIFEKDRSANDSVSIAVVFYKNFSVFLPERFLVRHASKTFSSHNDPDLEYELHSRLVAVAMQTGTRKDPVKDEYQRLKVKARLAHLNHTVNRQIIWNISCGVADFSLGNVQFLMEGCQPVQTGNFSLCQCDRVGTYAVLLTTYAQSDDLLVNASFDVVAGMGCAISAFFACLTFFILLVLWRKISSVIAALKLQFCFSLIGVYGVMLRALSETHNQGFYPYSVFLGQFFFLAAFCLQLGLSLCAYIDVIDFNSLKHHLWKLSILGWAVPGIVVGAALVVQSQESFDMKSWWLKLYSHHLYTFSTTIAIMIMLQITLAVTAKSELQQHRKQKITSKMKYRSQLLNRSFFITALLLWSTVSSVIYVNYDHPLCKYILAASSGILGFTVFLAYTAFSENVKLLCSSKKSIEEKDYLKEEPSFSGGKNRKSSFQSFLSSEIISDNYCIGRSPETLEVMSSLQHVHRMGYPIPPAVEVKTWKEGGESLEEKPPPMCIVRDFTVHNVQSQKVPPTGRPNEIQVLKCTDSEAENSHFELQQLEDSPKSGHIIDDEKQSEIDYELNHQGSAPDILEPTNHVAAQGSTTEDQPKKNDLNLSTFRQPQEPITHLSTLDVLSSRSKPEPVESDSDDQKPSSFGNTPCPAIQSMIGDDKLGTDSNKTREAEYLIKKDIGRKGINVPTPKVPNLDKDKILDVDGKKGWSMTTV